METLQRQKTFDFESNKITVTFPNVGQMIDMESLKQSLTGNRYGTMSASGVKSMFFALDMVDAIAFFETMCPKIRRILGVKTLAELSPEDMVPVVKAYKQHVAPWYNELLKDLYKIGESDGEVKESASNQED
jgi:hypothetical protein